MEHTEDEFIKKHHNHSIRANQCSSYILKRIKAPIDLVWSLIRRFDNDVQGDYLKIGSTRKLTVQSELHSTATVTERLDILDEEERMFQTTMIDGDQRMRNCKLIVTVHPDVLDGRSGCFVVESYLVDLADRWYSKEETCRFVEDFIHSYLESLARRSERQLSRKPRKQKPFKTRYIITEPSRFRSIVQERTTKKPRKQKACKTRYIITEPTKFRSIVQELTGMHSIDQSVLYGYEPKSDFEAIENVADDDKIKKMKQDTLPASNASSPKSSATYQSSLTVTSRANDQSESFAVQDPWHERNSKQECFEEMFGYPFEDLYKNTHKDDEFDFSVGIDRELVDFSSKDEPSLTDEWKAQEINLTNGRCSDLPENPICPFLVKLFLQDNNYLTEVPHSFFKYLPNLEVLNMSNTSIKKLPSSISKLLKLQELSLRNCKMLMELPPEIGFLKDLKVLDLEGTELIRLPREIMWLLRLELLKFSLYKYAIHQEVSSIIPKNVLSKLSYLKELSIVVSPECEWWEGEVEAILADLGKLGNLAKLDMHLPTHQLFQKLLELRCIKRLKMDVVMPLLYPTLSNFRFVVGRCEDPVMSCVPHDLQEEFEKLDKCLKLVNLGDYLDPKVLQHVSALFIRRHWSVRSLSEFDLSKMDNLKFCLLAECDSMKEILDGHQLDHVVNNSGSKSLFGSLRYLGVHCMKNLFHIWNGPAVKGCFSELKILAIHTCPNLTTIFNNGFLEDLIFLQELIIEDCSEVESLVADDYLYVKMHQKNLLPSLRKISLLHLPRFKNLSRGHFIASRLEKMVIYNCPKLENFHPLQMCSKYVKEIKGESKWFESNKSGLSKEEHDYLISVFVPLKDDDDDTEDGDYDEINELAEAVRVSLTCQDIGSNDDLIVDMEIEMKENFKEHQKDASLSDEPSSVELLSSSLIKSNTTSVPMFRYYSCLLADCKPRKNPNFLYASFACTVTVVSISHYNLSDDSIPEDLSGLSCLSELDLSFTPISQLHNGIKWPKGLKILNLNGCINLRSLQEFPALLEVLAVNDCDSLERIYFGSKKLALESTSVRLLSNGCNKLVDVDSAFGLDPYTAMEVNPVGESDYSSKPVTLGPPESTKFPIKKSRESKSWKKQVHISQASIDDGYHWRKYGQKLIKGSKYPRIYYRCATAKGCQARKHVERSLEEDVTITYGGVHTCTQDTNLTPQLHSQAADTLQQDTQAADLSAPPPTPQPEETLPTTQTGLELTLDELLFSSNDVDGHDFFSWHSVW